MQISVISLMILLSPWLCGSSVVNMSCSTREFGKCVKTQLQLVCSNYGPREFITISLLIKRDFRIWINTARKDPRQGGRRVSAERRGSGAVPGPARAAPPAPAGRWLGVRAPWSRASSLSTRTWSVILDMFFS